MASEKSPAAKSWSRCGSTAGRVVVVVVVVVGAGFGAGVVVVVVTVAGCFGGIVVVVVVVVVGVAAGAVVVVVVGGGATVVVGARGIVLVVDVDGTAPRAPCLGTHEAAATSMTAAMRPTMTGRALMGSLEGRPAVPVEEVDRRSVYLGFMTMKRFGLLMMLVGGLLVAAGLVSYFAGGDGTDLAAASTTSTTSTTSTSTTSTTAPPAPTTSAVPSTTTPPTPTTVAMEENETVEEFVDLFATALEQGDLDFVWRRLHPDVVAVGGEELCRAWVEREIMALSDYRLLSITAGPALVSGIPDVYTAAVSFQYQGQVFDDGVGQFALVDGTLRWLGVCR